MVQFTYSGYVLVLPSPKLGDLETIDLRTKTDRSMNGNIWTYKDAPALSQFHIEFEHVNRPKVIEVINFLKVSEGQAVQYTDYNGDIFKVVILNDPFESVHASIRNNQFSFDLEVIP